MSNFKLKTIGTYKVGFTKDQRPFIQLMFTPELLAKVKPHDLSKIYLFEPKSEGKITGLLEEVDEPRTDQPGAQGDSLPLFSSEQPGEEGAGRNA